MGERSREPRESYQHRHLTITPPHTKGVLGTELSQGQGWVWSLECRKSPEGVTAFPRISSHPHPHPPHPHDCIRSCAEQTTYMPLHSHPNLERGVQRVPVEMGTLGHRR